MRQTSYPNEASMKMTGKKLTMESIPPLVEPKSAEETRERLRLRIVDFDTEINKMNRDSLESTQRMVTLIESTNEQGLEALSKLEEQDEQLDKIEENMFQISDDLGKVKRDIKKMEHCCFSLRKFFCWPVRRARTLSFKDCDAPYIKQSKTPAEGLVLRHSFNKQHPGERTATRLTEDVIEEEIEKNLHQIDTTLQSVKHLAVDIDVQLRIQEPKLERIIEMVENNDVNMDGANEKIHKMLN